MQVVGQSFDNLLAELRFDDLLGDEIFQGGVERGSFDMTSLVKGGSLAYIAEGFGESYDWKEMIKKEQRSNGSIFNSPSATAAALIHLPDDRCFEYLQSVLKVYGKAGNIF
ncbi:hypothetical protein LguiB_001747 [Lonicera macranthoides]